MNDSNILQLFEGLTADQMKEFRRRIVPALVEIRAEVVNTITAEKSSNEKITRGKTDAMHSNSDQRKAM